MNSKTTIALLIFVICAFCAQAQNFAVRFWPASSGMPTNWPCEVLDIGTNTTSEPFVLLTVQALQQVFAVKAAEYSSWESNQLFIARTKADPNMARIIQLFEQIPAARTQMTNIKTSTISSVAAASTAIKTSANVIDGILEELQRLGPVLKELYRPDNDDTK